MVRIMWIRNMDKLGEDGHPLSAAGTVVDPCCIRLPKQMKKQ